MKRIFSLLLCICLFLGTFSRTAFAAPSWPSDISIQADGGILMDADTGTVLYSKNMDEPYYPASITKILTALLVLENCSLDEMVTFSHDDVYNVEAGSSSAGIDEGDVLSVKDCLYALMLASANESANALACHVSGSREAFADLMNEKAKELGCTGSHFANPSGLNDENHYTTAHDMALIAREAIKNPDFLEINQTRSYKLPPIKRSPEGGYVANHHKMLMKNEPEYYSGAFAGKTGYTSLAGNTLVTCAQRDGMTLIAVVLNGHQSHYTDTRALFDFGFANFQSLKAIDYETTYRSLENDMTIGNMTAQSGISLELDKNGTVVLPKSAQFSDMDSELSYDLTENAPENAIAKITYSYAGTNTGDIYLLTPEQTAVKRSTPPSMEAAGSESGEVSPPTEDTVLPETLQETESLEKTEEKTGSLHKAFSLSPALLIGAVLFILLASAVLFKLYRDRKEKEDLLLRRQRRLERLEDMGYSSSDFDQLLSQRRSSMPSYRTKRRQKKNRKKNILR